MKRNVVPPSVWRNPLHLLAFGFGSGAAPYAPGTFGTAAAIPLYLLIQPLPLLGYATVVALMFVVGIWLCQRTSEDLGVHDHGGIVWDEFVGFLVTMLAVPLTLHNVVVGFLLFRVFDVLKPWPIEWIDRRVNGGLGIMADDLLAGLYAALTLHALLRI